MIAILDARAAGLLGRQHLANNVLAGIVVGIVALPLAMAFAIASGARPEQGLYTAIVAGFLTSALGGSRLQIGGPTGAFIVILAAITAEHGIAGLQVATLMAGVILLVLGVSRLGGVIRFIPRPVITGFTSGIAVIIFVGQCKDFFGLDITGAGRHFHEKLIALATALPDLHPATTGLGLATLAVLIVSPRILRRIPAPLVALVFATIVQAVGGFAGIATIGSAFGGIPQSLPSFVLPSVSLSDVIKLIGPAFTIAMLGAIESLLSAVVADGMAGTRHDSNQELIGQGIANIAAPLFGGFASTGAIARTATNIRNGATSPLAGMVHALTLVIIVLVLAPLAAHIPLCALAAILFVVAFNMSEARHFVDMLRTMPKPDVAILLITFLLTVFADIVVAVNVGVIVAALLFMRSMIQTVEISPDDTENASDAATQPGTDPDTLVYRIEGPLFFGVAEQLAHTLSHINNPVRAVILRLGRVPFIDATGLHALGILTHDFKQAGTRVILCEARPHVAEKLVRAGIVVSVDAASGDLARAFASARKPSFSDAPKA